MKKIIGLLALLTLVSCGSLKANQTNLENSKTGASKTVDNQSQAIALYSEDGGVYSLSIAKDGNSAVLNNVVLTRTKDRNQFVSRDGKISLLLEIVDVNGKNILIGSLNGKDVYSAKLIQKLFAIEDKTTLPLKISPLFNKVYLEFNNQITPLDRVKSNDNNYLVFSNGYIQLKFNKNGGTFKLLKNTYNLSEFITLNIDGQKTLLTSNDGFKTARFQGVELQSISNSNGVLYISKDKKVSIDFRSKNIVITVNGKKYNATIVK